MKTSNPCNNPTSAFKEIEAVIKATSNKKRHRKPDARSNGKLYMAVMYSATQRLLRERFRGSEAQVPDEVRPTFMEWMENVPCSKAFSSGMHEMVGVCASGSLPAGASMNPIKSIMTTTSAPQSLATTGSTTSISQSKSTRSASAGTTVAKTEQTGNSKYNIFNFDLDADIVSHLDLEDVHIESFFVTDKLYENGSPRRLPTPRKRASTLEDYASSLLPPTIPDPGSTPSSRKRSSGSIDEQSPVLLTRKRASGSVDEDSPILKELDALPPRTITGPTSVGIPSSNTGLVDPSDMFAECFKLTDSSVNKSMPPPPPRAPAVSVSSSQSTATPPYPPLPSLASNPALFDDLIDPSDLFDMTPTQLRQILRSPRKEMLSLSQVRAAIAMLLQIPRESMSMKALEELYTAAERRSGGMVTMEAFLETLENKEKEIAEQFTRIDRDNKGEISLETIRTARTQGILRPEDLDMEDLQDKMSSLHFGANNHLSADRKIPYLEFRSIMLAVPSAASIRTVIEMVRPGLNDSNELDFFSL